MTVSSSHISFILVLVLNVVQGTLTPNGNVSVDCGSRQTFTCRAPDEPIEWTTSGLSGISRGPFLARNEAPRNSRITSPDTGGDLQFSVSDITISGFSRSDNGGTIQCINVRNSNVRGMASISVVPLPLPPPTNVAATVNSCDTVTLQWTQPSEPNDITTSVSCTPPSAGCTECTTSPCTITGLNPSTEYVFTVTLNSGWCRASMSTTTARTKGGPANVVATVELCDVTLQWDQPSEPADITTSVSCIPPSPGCAECTTSPCTITGLNPSTEYNFTVTLDSSMCATSRSTTGVFKIEDSPCVAPNSNSNDTPTDTPVGNQSAPLAALAVLVLLLIPLLYPLGVLIAKYGCFRNKSYCEVFWCCGCFRKDKSPRYNSTELMTSPRHREEVEYQNVNKGKECYLHVKGNLEHIQSVNDGKEYKDQTGNNHKLVGTYETVEQLGDNDGDVVTDETVEQQGYEDGITYADLDFSGQREGNINVVHSVEDDITYAAV